MEVMDHLERPEQLQDLITGTNVKNKCDPNSTIGQHKCYTSDESNPQCAIGLVSLVLEIIASKPEIFDEKAMQCLISHLNNNSIKFVNLVTADILLHLHRGSSPSQTRTWLKYENLIVNAIKKDIYDTETMANEILGIVHKEIDPVVARKFSSLLGSCVKVCREKTKSKGQDEDEEKWCEIIDWMSWFLGSEEDEL